MKKIITITIGLLTAYGAAAQRETQLNSMEIFRGVLAAIVLILFMVFIMNILKNMLAHRLKNKIVDKGVPENIVSSILQPTVKDERHTIIKWFFILAGLGLGFLVVNYTLPMGFHSLAIMCFSISLSFLGYHIFTKKPD
jgi:multisubunit Na+/H+ antiporter MnhB subunit